MLANGLYVSFQLYDAIEDQGLFLMFKILVILKVAYRELQRFKKFNDRWAELLILPDAG